MYPQNTLPDEMLLRRLAAGDEGAFTELYTRYWTSLYDAAYKRIESRQEAEDIVQEVFMKLWDRRAKVKIDNIGAYLATACKFVFFQQLVKEKRRAELLEQHVSPVASIDEEEKIFARFLSRYISSVVEQLQILVIPNIGNRPSTGSRVRILDAKPETSGSVSYVLAPNPATNHTTVSSSSDKLTIQMVRLINKNGNSQRIPVLKRSHNQWTLDVSSLALNVYVLMIYDGKQWHSKQFIKM